MAKKDMTVQADGSLPQKPTLAQTLFATLAGIIAVRLATYFMATMWRLVTKEDPPQLDMNIPVAKKAAWVALVGAAAGASRQAARDIIKPPVSGPA